MSSNIRATTADLHVDRSGRLGSGALEETTRRTRAWSGESFCVGMNGGVDQQIGRLPKEGCRTKMGTGNICRLRVSLNAPGWSHK